MPTTSATRESAANLGNGLYPGSPGLDIDPAEPGIGNCPREFLCEFPRELRHHVLDLMVVDRGDVGHAHIIGRDQDGARRDLFFERS